MTTQEDLLSALSVTEADAVRSMISGTPFCYLGVITEVVSDGIVRVVPSVIGNPEEFFEVDCVLATVASQSFSIKVVPHAGDKVRVYSPMRYSNKMFRRENDGTVLAPNSRGYSIFTGIAVLENQFQKDTHLNFITVDDGKLEAKLAYDEESSSHNFSVSIDGSGAFSADIGYDKEEGGYKANLSVSDDGSFSFSNKKASVSIDSSGNVTIETEGKFTFKNKSGKNLYTILKGILGILNSTLKTFGSPASHQVVPSQFQQQEADLDSLME